MSTSELRRGMWPLPWWVVVVPAIVIAGVTGHAVVQAGEWDYIAPARLSGLARESVAMTGVLAASAAAWIATRFLDRRSPMAAPTAARADGRLVRRVAATLVVGWVGPQLAVAAAATWIVGRQATGGRLYPVEVLLAGTSLAFFLLSGLAIGVALARWHAPLWAALRSLVWVFVAPVYYSDVVPHLGTDIEYFLFPASQATPHRPLMPWVMVGIVVWWAVVLAAWIGLLDGLQRAFARWSPSRLIAASTALVVLASIGLFALPRAAASPFSDTVGGDIVCSPLGELDVCVLDEQQPVLADLRDELAPLYERIGYLIPDRIVAVANLDARQVLVGRGVDPLDVFVTGLGLGPFDDPWIDVGMSLGGADACEPDERGAYPYSYSVASAFGEYLRVGDGPSDDPWPLLDQFQEAGEDAVLAWYQDNQDALLDCEYGGDGPR